MNILLRIALLGTLSCLLSCLLGCQNEADDKAAREMPTVNQEFIRLKNEGLLPGLQRDATGGKASVWRVYDSGRKQEWFAPMAACLGECKKVYCVDVNFSGRRLIYLFCFDRNPPKLLGSFEEQAGQMVALPPPPAQKMAATNSVAGQVQ